LLQPTTINLTLSCSQNNLKHQNIISIVCWCLNLFNLQYTISTNKKGFLWKYDLNWLNYENFKVNY
jgi:hypothetical protein